MLDVKNNFKNKYSEADCPHCDSEVDDQKHVLACSELADGMDLFDSTVKYLFIQCWRFKSKFQNKERSYEVIRGDPGEPEFA